MDNFLVLKVVFLLSLQFLVCNSSSITPGHCGGYADQIEGHLPSGSAGFTYTSVNKWEGGIVDYSFVSKGTDSTRNQAFYVDRNIGFNQVL